MVTNDEIEEIMPRLNAARFRATSTLDPPHEYIMTHYRPEYVGLWHEMRRLILLYGEDRPFFKSRQRWRYLDMPDGYSYWIMPPLLKDDYRDFMKRHPRQVLNRTRTDGWFNR